MSGAPTKDHRGQGSYEDRTRNYQEQQRQQQVAANAQRTREDGLKPGASGKPVQHFVQAKSRADAENIARNLGHGHTPVHDTRHSADQSPHFHVTGPTGERGNKNTPHVNYPQKNSCLGSPKSQRKNQS